jgi:sugar/nucleoside kinase (ribokinase family)
MKTSDDEIYLCSQIDDQSYEYFKPEFEKVNKEFLDKVKSIPKVHLVLHKAAERHEAYENITNNLQLRFINFNSFDGILINMITGFDISLEQLQYIRKNSSALIYFDIHTFSRGLGENYVRNFRLIPDFDQWLKCLDIVQVNQFELFTISKKESEPEIVEEIISLGVQYFCITKGEQGAKVYYNHNGEINSYFISARKVNNPHLIGCGDVFGAAFFYSYIRKRDVIESINTAIKAAELLVNKG